MIEDQLRETPDKSLRWVAKMLGVHHTTVGSVRGEMQSTGEISQLTRTLGQDGKYHPATKPLKVITRSPVEQKHRIEAATLILGDCRRELKKLASQSIDAIITDPIYPEVDRAYGRISEDQWHSLMREVVTESRRILKPKGSAVFIFQPNYEKIGKMRLWLWEFFWSAKEWNLIQDVYWWSIDAHATGRDEPQARTSSPERENVRMARPCRLLPQTGLGFVDTISVTSARHRADIALRVSPSGRHYRNSTLTKAADERGGTTPFNLLPICAGGQSGGAEHHPAATPYDVAAWWCKYILPSEGVLLDPFCGSGTMLQAGLNHGASKVIGIDKEKKYLAISKRRITNG